MEFLTCKEEILRMLDGGYTKIQVYKTLASQGKLTTTRWNFYRVLKKLGANKRKLEPLKIGAELVEEAAKKLSTATNWERTRLPVPEQAGNLMGKPKETKTETGGDGSFGLEKREQDEYF